MVVGVIVHSSPQRRQHSYYLTKVALLMWLITGFSAASFTFPREDFESRASLLATMFLSTAAVIFIVNGELPKTPKLNKLDVLILGTEGVIVAGLIGAYIEYTLDRGCSAAIFYGALGL
jgi:hypothetical protein